MCVRGDVGDVAVESTFRLAGDEREADEDGVDEGARYPGIGEDGDDAKDADWMRCQFS